MLAQIHNCFSPESAKLAALAFAALVFSSCATKPEPQLVSDGQNARESSLPWNKQEKWEGAGALGPISGGIDRDGGR